MVADVERFALALDDAVAGELPQHAGHGLARGADAAGDLGVGPHGAHHPVARRHHVELGEAHDLGIDPVHRAHRAEVHDTVVALPNDGGEPRRHLNRDLGIVEQQGAEDLGRQRGQPAVLDRDHAGRARLAVEGGNLSEVAPLADVGEGDLAARGRVVDDADGAHDDEEDVAVLAVAVEHHRVVAIGVPAAALLDRAQGLGIER